MFYSVSGSDMFDVIKKNKKLDEVLSSQMISYRVLKKYLQMNKMEELYCHFFKTNTTQNDEIIHKSMVVFNSRKRETLL